ncbi:CDP-diacylglycerol--glycerol-3-phosphate 3-phosphatidyltransferase [Stackebrandtia nassauensis]|uniref:CDP-diacylglycerol--glycerol-3-phosphate 3-phosphatidyltransferase n=1 Tax=Stackebrandtia nassauensis (strain DSM 44728 / CIP 108903 / NRRL B-16338 / NBRC 102104 / LLR-40K-21) TaxID=446470 RepID=D3Q2H7_STANL|nr:CDP-diacylglycerol--glycerol-3-phosphate 3-phosphatidyltransferase [Stackebrandtia nassauensis]ADD43910.1 CDP-diacylglycerol/glycerol-3-phosphate3-phosphatidyl transferase [Stackebrandtia nassauensis DSM 44728]
MPREAPGASIYNIPNLLTVLRLLLIPAFVLCAIESQFTNPGWRWAAALVFTAAAVTDYVDGWLARRIGQVTAFGKIADPIADKALTGTALVLFSLWDLLPWWVTIVILVRELGITALRFWVIRLGIIAASRGGKIKTVLQIVAIVWYLVPLPELLAMLAPWVMAAATIATVVSGADYIVQVVRLRHQAGRNGDGDTGAAAGAVEPTPQDDKA